MAVWKAITTCRWPQTLVRFEIACPGLYKPLRPPPRASQSPPQCFRLSSKVRAPPKSPPKLLEAPLTFTCPLKTIPNALGSFFSPLVVEDGAPRSGLRLLRRERHRGIRRGHRRLVGLPSPSDHACRARIITSIPGRLSYISAFDKGSHALDLNSPYPVSLTTCRPVNSHIAYFADVTAKSAPSQPLFSFFLFKSFADII